MSDVSLLNKKKFVVNDKITVHIPTIKEIRGDSPIAHGTDKDEEEVYSIVNLFSSTSSDIMVELDEMGIDFTTWSDFTTFLMLFSGMIKDSSDVLRRKSHLLFENINLADFEVSINEVNELPILYDAEHDIIIDEFIYMQLSTIFCTMHSIDKVRRKPGDKTARDYIIERQKTKAKRRKKRNYTSRFDKQIIALVNHENFKYNYETVEDLTVYNFMCSLKQIVKKYQVDNLYHGVYAGTVNAKQLGNKLNWLDYE